MKLHQRTVALAAAIGFLVAPAAFAQTPAPADPPAQARQRELEDRGRPLFDREQLQPSAARSTKLAGQEEFFQRRNCKQYEATGQMLFARNGHLKWGRLRRQVTRLKPEQDAHEQRNGGENVIKVERDFCR